MHHPVPAPAAALRSLRRAAWQGVNLPALADARAALTGPVGELASAWVRLCEAHDAYTQCSSAEHWQALQAALVAFDAACMPFHGPSGWETRDRPQALYPTSIGT